MDKIERPIGVVLIAFANLVIYVAVLAYVINLRSTAHPYYGSGWLAVDLISFAGVTYSTVGIIGVLGLLVRWRSFHELAMIGWAFECVIFSIIGFLGGWTRVYDYSSSYIFYHYQVIFLAVSLVLFKIISIVYFARKKT